MLRLNPRNNQGMRDVLVPLLFDLNADDEADALLNRSEYAQEQSSLFLYAQALLEFRRRGPTPESRQKLRLALTANVYVAGLLLGQMDPPPVPPETYSPGEPSEAAAFFPDIERMWAKTPGAMEWLESCPPPVRRATRKRSSGKGGKGKPRGKGKKKR